MITYRVVDLITEPATNKSGKQETETQADVCKADCTSTKVVDIREEGYKMIQSVCDVTAFDSRIPGKVANMR